MDTSIITETLTGTLEDVPLKNLLLSLAESQKTGLILLDEKNEVWLHEGLIYLVKTTQSAPIAEALFNADVGSVSEIEALFTTEHKEGYVSDRIINQHPSSKQVLARVLHEYNLKGLFELLVPSNASFIFEAERKHKLGFVFAEETKPLIIEAEHRLHIWTKIATAVPSTEAIFILNKNLPNGQMERLISADEWQYISRLDGKTSVASIAHETGESGFRVCSTLYRFLLEGVISEIS